VTKRANGEGSVYQRPDGKWVGQADLGWHDGRRHRKYVLACSKTEATNKLRTVLSARQSGQIITSNVPTVAAWFDTYLNEVAAKRVRPSTLNRYCGDVRNHIVPNIGRVRLDKLQPGHLSALYSRKLAGGMSPASVRHLHAVLRRALNVATKWQLVTMNVASLVEPPSVTQHEISPLSREEAQRLLGAVRGDRLEARWAVGLSLGLRQGEVLGLGWEDVDLDAATLTVRRALQRQRGAGLVFTQPKTARSRRTISLPAPLVALLRTHRTRQLEERLAAGTMWLDHDLVFASVTGRPVDARADWHAFKAVLTRAGLRDVRLHDLRHTAASLLLLQGVSARVVMEILGHSQIALTLNTYSHVAPELQTDALDRVGRALWG